MITRREFLRGVGFGLTCLASTGYAQSRPVTTSRPNVIIVLCDDLGYGDLGCYGHPIIRSPHLDRFAREGIRFTSFYAAAPNCSPSRAGLLTGRTPYRVGMYDVVGKKTQGLTLPTSEITIAKTLAAAGYETAHFGKWHLTPTATPPVGTTKPSSVIPHGFKHSYSKKAPATELVRVFSSWLSSRAGSSSPFFAYIGLHESHEPVNRWSPPAFQQMYAPMPKGDVPDGGVMHPKTKAADRMVYYGCVSQLDSAFGALLRALEENGQRENTVVFFTSDNGPDNRCQYSFGSPGPFRGCKGRLYEGGIRVPALMQWPRGLGGGQTIDEPLISLDLLSTICGIAGVAPPTDRKIDGIDFRPALDGQKLKRTEPLYWAMWEARGGVQYAIRENDWKLLARSEPLPDNVSVIDHIKKGKIIGYELYNLRTDPGESVESSQREPEILARLTDSFRRHQAEVLAEGPMVNLEEHRRKARWAWPSGDFDPDTADDSMED